MGEQYGGDHQDFRGGEFNGDFTAKKVEYHQHAPAPTALDSLPPKAAGFTGRGDQLGELLGAFDPDGSGEAPGAVLVAAVSGLGGIGKTALAVQAVHEACDRGGSRVGCSSSISMDTTMIALRRNRRWRLC